MSKIEFDEFIENDDYSIESIDWAYRKTWYINQVKLLFESIEELLDEYIKNNKIKIEYSEIEIYEDYIGAYKVDEMYIYIKNHIIKLTPIGTILIGSNGRVDLTCGFEKVSFVLVNSFSNNINDEINLEDGLNEDEVWKIAINPPEVNFLELNQDNLLDSILKLCNG